MYNCNGTLLQGIRTPFHLMLAVFPSSNTTTETYRAHVAYIHPNASSSPLTSPSQPALAQECMFLPCRLCLCLSFLKLCLIGATDTHMQTPSPTHVLEPGCSTSKCDLSLRKLVPRSLTVVPSWACTFKMMGFNFEVEKKLSLQFWVMTSSFSTFC